MSTVMNVADHPGPGDEHAHPTPLTYVVIGIVLAAITAAEVFAYSAAIFRPWLSVILVALSAVKFILVVSFYMHLRFDSAYFRAMFIFGLAVAGSIISVLLLLFGSHPLPPNSPLLQPHG